MILLIREPLSLVHWVVIQVALLTQIFYSTGVTKLGYVPITQTQLRMIFADSVTAPFFNIYRHPKNMEVTDTIFAAGEAQYSGSREH